jgi:CheY-like chemotaxis protein
MSGKRNSDNVTAYESRSSSTIDNRPRVLVVDDEPVIADTIVKILRLNGYGATAAYDAEGALEAALVRPPELLITDVILPEMNGIELALTVKRVFPDCGVILFSGQASAKDLLANARRAGSHFTLLTKPVPPMDLLETVAAHLNTARSMQFATAGPAAISTAN